MRTKSMKPNPEWKRLFDERVTGAFDEVYDEFIRSRFVERDAFHAACRLLLKEFGVLV